MGESTSDFSVHAMNPVLAVVLGFCGFAVALSLQFWVRRYIAWTYWLAVVGVGVFGRYCCFRGWGERVEVGVARSTGRRQAAPRWLLAGR
jgi:uncharacterized membrane-anchored protein